MKIVNDGPAAERVSDVLAGYPDQKFYRSQLIKAVELHRNLLINTEWLTRYWSRIEAAVLDRHLIYPRIVSNRRESNVLTRMGRDLEGGVLVRLARTEVDMALRKERFESHIVAVPDLGEELELLTQRLIALPLVPETAYMRNGHP